jgi:hypothetical protein
MVAPWLHAGVPPRTQGPEVDRRVRDPGPGPAGRAAQLVITRLVFSQCELLPTKVSVLVIYTGNPTWASAWRTSTP